MFLLEHEGKKIADLLASQPNQTLRLRQQFQVRLISLMVQPENRARRIPNI